MKKLLVLILAILFAACSPATIATTAMDALSGGDDSGVSVDSRIAKEANDSVVVGENERTDIKAEEVNITEIVNKNYSVSLIIIAILGWILPTPTQMGKGIWRLIKKRKDE